MSRPARAKVASARVLARRLGVRIEIAREIRSAFIAGQTRTDLRPFLDFDERLGAMRCCRRTGIKRPRACPRPSTHVTYLVGFSGRLAYCAKHAAKEFAA